MPHSVAPSLSVGNTRTWLNVSLNRSFVPPAVGCCCLNLPQPHPLPLPLDDVAVAFGDGDGAEAAARAGEAGGAELVVRRAHCLFMLISVMRYNAGRPVKKDSNNVGETTTWPRLRPSRGSRKMAS